MTRSCKGLLRGNKVEKIYSNLNITKNQINCSPSSVKEGQILQICYTLQKRVLFCPTSVQWRAQVDMQMTRK